MPVAAVLKALGGKAVKALVNTALMDFSSKALEFIGLRIVKKYVKSSKRLWDDNLYDVIVAANSGDEEAFLESMAKLIDERSKALEDHIIKNEKNKEA